jgi:hypothetical protein
VSNVTVFNPGQLPAHLRNVGISDTAKALAGGGQTGNRLSIKGGVFRLVVDGKEIAAIEERHLDIVIVAAAPKVSRTFYIAKYDPENPAGPDCWSQNGDFPDATSKAKQSANCASCPQNVKGSGQGDSRACRYSQRVAVVLANDLEGDVMQLSLPALSLFGRADGDNRPLQEYARWLTAQGIDPTMLVTRLKFDTKSESPKLFFKAMRWLEQEEFDICREAGASEDAQKAILMNPAQMDGVAPAPAAPVNVPGQRPTAAPAAAAPAPAPEEDDEPPAPPPKRRAAAPAPAVDPDAEPPAAPPKARKPRVAAAAPAAVNGAAGAARAPAPEPEADPVLKPANTPAPVVPTGALADVLAAWDD